MSEDESKIPHIDVFNIDDSCFEDCKYVLTSPRSLEACHRLNFQVSSNTLTSDVNISVNTAIAAFIF